MPKHAPAPIWGVAPPPLFHAPSILLGFGVGLIFAAGVLLFSGPTWGALKKHAAHYLTDDRITWQSTGMVPKGASGWAQQAPTP